MRKLSEIKNEEALDVLVDILDPVTELFTDSKFEKKFKTDIKEAIKYVVKAHKKAIIEILAGLEGIPIEEYNVNLIEIPMRLFELFNDEDLMNFFHSQGLKIPGMSFGSVMANTEANE